jgi:hypothetical protein
MFSSLAVYGAGYRMRDAGWKVEDVFGQLRPSEDAEKNRHGKRRTENTAFLFLYSPCQFPWRFEKSTVAG